MINLLGTWRAQAEKSTEDEFLKTEQEQADATRKAIDAAWESYQHMLKIAKQSSLPDFSRQALTQDQENFLKKGPPPLTIIPPAKPNLPIGNGTTPVYGGVDPELVKLQNDSNEALKETQQVLQSIRTPAEVYADEVDRLSYLLASGRISQEEFGKAVERSPKP